MKFIFLGQKTLVALVDDIDFEWISRLNWHVHSAGYAAANTWDPVTKKASSVLMHRLTLQAQAGQEVDHFDGNRLNNQRSNLRLCSRRQNNGNAQLKRTSFSSYKGVTSNRGYWRARIAEVHLGYFATEIEAAKAYDVAARREFGTFASLNFPSDAEPGLRHRAEPDSVLVQS